MVQRIEATERLGLCKPVGLLLVTHTREMRLIVREKTFVVAVNCHKNLLVIVSGCECKQWLLKEAPLIGVAREPIGIKINRG